MPWSCTDSSLLHLFRTRDPSGKGLHSAQALRLLMLLLHWNPAMRPTPEQVCAAAAAPPSRSLRIMQHTYPHQGSSGTQRPRHSPLPHVASALPHPKAAGHLQHAPQHSRLGLSFGICRRCGTYSSPPRWRSRRRGMSSHALASGHGRAGVDCTCFSIVPMPEHAIAPVMRRQVV